MVLQVVIEILIAALVGAAVGGVLGYLTAMRWRRDARADQVARVVPDMVKTVALLEPSESPLTVMLRQMDKRNKQVPFYIRLPGTTPESIRKALPPVKPPSEYVRWMEDEVEAIPRASETVLRPWPFFPPWGGVQFLGGIGNWWNGGGDGSRTR